MVGLTGGEKVMASLTVLIKCRRVTDEKTDGMTDILRQLGPRYAYAHTRSQGVARGGSAPSPQATRFAPPPPKFFR